MRFRDPVLCRRCLLAYTTVIVAITGAYLYLNWGVHNTYLATRADLIANDDGAGDLEGMAFAESGGAEYLLVVLYHAFHVVILGLLLFGRKRNMVMGVACALLLACSLMYLIFYACLIMQAKLEQFNSLTGPGDVPLHKPGKPAPYKLTKGDVDSTIASGNAGADAVVDQAPAGQDSGTCQSSGPTSMHGGAPLSYSDLGWTVLETLVDVMAAIVAGPDDDEGGVQRYHQDGMPIADVAPFAPLRRLSMVLVSVVGLGLSFWGVMTFDLSPQGRAMASNPGLTASALSQLAGAQDSAATTTGKTAAATERRAERSQARRRERVAAALQETTAAPAAQEAKKNQ